MKKNKINFSPKTINLTLLVFLLFFFMANHELIILKEQYQKNVQPNEFIANIASNQNAEGSNPIQLSYSTYFGGMEADLGRKVILDEEGNVWVLGNSLSEDNLLINGFNTSLNGFWSDLFIMKFSPDGKILLFSTYLGGSANDYGSDIEIDDDGNIWILGYTESIDFPTTSDALEPIATNVSLQYFIYDGFLCKLSGVNGSLLYSTYLGGNNDVIPTSMAINSLHDIIITGSTNSDDLPTTKNAPDDTFNGGNDVFVWVINPNENQTIFCTYLGGTNSEGANSVNINSEDDIWITGGTSSGRLSGFPITEKVINDTHSGETDVFVCKFDFQTKYELEYSSYIGGSDVDQGKVLLIDSNDLVWIIGYASYDYPTTMNAYDTTHNGGPAINPVDVFVSILSSDGIKLEYSTFIGGSMIDDVYSCAFDTNGNLWMIGDTSSDDFPVTNNAYDRTHNGPIGHEDVVVFVLNNNKTDLVYSSFFGGSDSDYAGGIAIGYHQQIWFTGQAGTGGFPLVNPFDSNNDGSTEMFISQLSIIDKPSPPLNLSVLLGLNKAVLLLWNSPLEDGNLPILRYCIYRGETSYSYSFLDYTTDMWYVDNSIQAGTIYYYVVTAINNYGESEYSNHEQLILQIENTTDLTTVGNGTSSQRTPSFDFLETLLLLGTIIIIQRKNFQSKLNE